MVMISEGHMPFGEYQTYYRIIGQCQPGKKPLLLLHGGPGSTHNYFETFDCLAEDGRAIISYDQLGCGLSAAPDSPQLWTARTWLDELTAIRRYLQLDQVHLLGQSWGGMMVIQYMCDEHPQGVSSIILASSVPSVKLWEQEGRRNIQLMPEQQQQALASVETSRNYEDPAYREAINAYMRRHCFAPGSMDVPACMLREKVFGEQSYITAWGNNEYMATGTLKDFEYLDKMHTIKAPALITSGVNDECTPLIAKSMYDCLPNARWELFSHSQHMSFITEHDKYMRLMLEWLNEHD